MAKACPSVAPQCALATRAIINQTNFDGSQKVIKKFFHTGFSAVKDYKWPPLGAIIAGLHCTHYARLLLFISVSLFCLSTVFMASLLVLVLFVAPSGPEIAGTGAVTPDNYGHKSQCYIYAGVIYYMYMVSI